MHVDIQLIRLHKGKGTKGKCLILKNSINKIRSKHKPVYIAFLGVTKAYDKAWLDARIYVMHKEGTPLDLWKIIKYLNTNSTAKLKTKYGLTCNINIKDSIRQGGISNTIRINNGWNKQRNTNTQTGTKIRQPTTIYRLPPTDGRRSTRIIIYWWTTSNAKYNTCHSE